MSPPIATIRARSDPRAAAEVTNRSTGTSTPRVSASQVMRSAVDSPVELEDPGPEVTAPAARSPARAVGRV
jgi:hypothetical protein